MNQVTSTRSCWWLFVIPFCLSMATPAGADAIRLRGGDVLTGPVLEHTDEYVVILHPDLGEMTISMDLITSVGPTPPPGRDAIEPATAAPTDDAKESPPAKPAADPEDGRWKAHLIFGGSFSNNDEGLKGTANVRGGLSRRTPDAWTELSLSYLYKETDGEATDNQATVIARQQWLKPESPWFWFVTGRYDFDDFRDWEHRIQGHGGPGYDLVKSDDFRLFSVAGLGGRKDFGSDQEPAEFEGQLGAGINWTISGRQRLNLLFNWYPELSGADERTSTILDWTYLIDAEAKLSFNIHLDYEYNTDPDPGFPRDNYTLTWGLQLDF